MEAISRFSHNFWSLYEYRISLLNWMCVCVHSCNYISPPVMLTIKPRIVTIFQKLSPISLEQMFVLYPTLEPRGNHTYPCTLVPLKHTCPIEIGNRIRHLYFRFEPFWCVGHIEYHEPKGIHTWKNFLWSAWIEASPLGMLQAMFSKLLCRPSCPTAKRLETWHVLASY